MDILMYLGLFLVSIIPSIILYKWLKKQIDDENYKSTCKKSLSIIFVFLIIRFAHKRKNLPLYTEPLVNKQ